MNLPSRVVKAKSTARKWGIVRDVEYEYLDSRLPISSGNVVKHYYFVNKVMKDGVERDIISNAPKSYFTKPYFKQPVRCNSDRR